MGGRQARHPPGHRPKAAHDGPGVQQVQPAGGHHRLPRPRGGPGADRRLPGEGVRPDHPEVQDVPELRHAVRRLPLHLPDLRAGRPAGGLLPPLGHPPRHLHAQQARGRIRLRRPGQGRRRAVRRGGGQVQDGDLRPLVRDPGEDQARRAHRARHLHPRRAHPQHQEQGGRSGPVVPDHHAPEAAQAQERHLRHDGVVGALHRGKGQVRLHCEHGRGDQQPGAGD
mmetsp:Transcript_46704/g.123368  ORF Transcript_46704/g.123368 Transcript_46704/m.123368 type:complete len:225 (-) Transcript_46704:373-1047(-)